MIATMPVIRRLTRLLGYVWTSPWTAVGFAIGLAGVATGGRMRRRGRVIEFHGGAVTWLLNRLTRSDFRIAMTLGHTILGQTDAALDISREHEMVHVRQYERWGPFFIPAYLGSSLVLLLAGRDAYRDNPFEREAFGEGDCHHDHGRR
jgi:hypothetical protein